MKKSPVVHFELPYKDAKRVAKFYEEAFGWGMQHFPDMGDYVLAQTTETDENNMVKTPGTINGGFYPQSDDYGKGHVVISVGNLEEAVEMIKKAGGRVKGEPKDIPGVGLFVMIEDSEGNEVGVLQPSEM